MSQTHSISNGFIVPGEWSVQNYLALGHSHLRQDQPFIKQMFIVLVINTKLDRIFVVSEAHLSLFITI